MDMVLIIANILSFIGNFLFTLSSILRGKKKILLCQSSNYIFSVISEFMMGAYSGMIQEGMSFFRNISLLFVKNKKKSIKLLVTLIFVISAVVAGILINIFYSDNVWYGYLPVCGTIVYSTAVILGFMLNVSEVKAEVIIKIGLLTNSFIWTAYGFFVKLYPIMIFNMITIILCIISLTRLKIITNKNKKIEETEEIKS